MSFTKSAIDFLEANLGGGGEYLGINHRVIYIVKTPLYSSWPLLDKIYEIHKASKVFVLLFVLLLLFFYMNVLKEKNTLF